MTKFGLTICHNQFLYMLLVHCHDEVGDDRFTKLLVDNKTDFVGWR